MNSKLLRCVQLYDFNDNKLNVNIQQMALLPVPRGCTGVEQMEFKNNHGAVGHLEEGVYVLWLNNPHLYCVTERQTPILATYNDRDATENE